MEPEDQSRVVELTKNGPVVSGSTDALRRRFDAQQCVVLRRLLSLELLEEVQRKVELAQWQNGDEYTDGAGTVLTSKDASGANALHFLLNNAEFLKLVAGVTGCEEISEFRFGAIYRMLPNDEHQLSWHDDLNDKENRQVGLSLNLSTEAFDGGAFQIREHLAKAAIAQVNNTGSGDALLFRVSPDLEHRVTAVAGAVPKTAFTGWFCATGQTHLSRLIDRLNEDRAVAR